MDSTEIIRQLQNDPALKAEMRAVLLTEELLAVPDVVATLAETMAQHNQRVEHLENTVSSLIDHQASMQNNLQDLIQMTARGFAAMESGFAEMREGLVGVQAKFDQVDAKFDQVDARFDQVDAGLDQVDARLDQIDARFIEVDKRFIGLDAKFTAKFDQVESAIRDLRGHLEN